MEHMSFKKRQEAHPKLRGFSLFRRRKRRFARFAQGSELLLHLAAIATSMMISPSDDTSWPPTTQTPKFGKTKDTIVTAKKVDRKRPKPVGLIQTSLLENQKVIIMSIY